MAVSNSTSRRWRSNAGACIPGLFACGKYLPGQTTGAKRDHVFAFARAQGEHQALVVVPRLISSLLPGAHGLPLGAEVWEDTALMLPETHQQRRWNNLFTGRAIDAGARQSVPVAEILGSFPVALLIS